MGGVCSKKPSTKGSSRKNNLYANGHGDARVSSSNYNKKSSVVDGSVSKYAPSEKEKLVEKGESKQSNVSYSSDFNVNVNDEFYDGIPHYQSIKSRSSRSKTAVAKDMSFRLGRAGTFGLEKAVEVLDTLGSSMTNLNTNSGFAAGVATKGNELSILSFEVANTIVKGSSLMQSLSKRSQRHLKEVAFPSEGVQNLVSTDTDELLRIFAFDKREELKVFMGEVVRFGNRCKDPQWHNLDRYFEKITRELNYQTQFEEAAESVMDILMSLVQYTAELYQELQVLDRMEQNCGHKCAELKGSSSSQKGDNSLAILRADIKSQKKQVRNLKKKSLWSRSLEEVMEKLVDIVNYLLLEIHTIFGSKEIDELEKSVWSKNQRLGPAGLSLHYANVVLQIDNMVARPSSIPPNIRESLYQNLPPNVQSALRSKLHSFRPKEELTITQIKDEMEKTLQWLVPLSANTAKDYHGFGWVGEWANAGSEANKRASGPTDVIRIETLHHADKEKTEAYILELVLWLHHLVKKSKTAANGGQIKILNKFQQQRCKLVNTVSLTSEEKEQLQNMHKNKRVHRTSRSQDFDIEKRRLTKDDRLCKSSSSLTSLKRKETMTVTRHPDPLVPAIDFVINKEKALDAVDRVEAIRKTS